VRTRVTESQEAGRQVCSVTGDLDLASVPVVREPLRLAAARSVPGPLVLDLTECQLLDSAGAGMIIGTIRRLANEGSTLIVVAPGGPVRRFLGQSGLDRLCSVVGSLPDTPVGSLAENGLDR